MSRESSAAISTRHIFPFLDLPYELQSLIYRKYYEGTEITLNLVNVDDDSTRDCQKKITFGGVPSSNIEYLNHQIRQDATKLKSVYLTRSLKINQPRLLPQMVERLLSDPRYSWVCEHIEDIYLSTRYHLIFWRINWPMFLQAFPNMKRLYLERLLFGRWIAASSYEKAVREFAECTYVETLTNIMTREFCLKPLADALSSTRREVWIGVRFHWNRRAMDTDEVFRVVMKGSIEKGWLWNVFCELIEDNSVSGWKEVPP